MSLHIGIVACSTEGAALCYRTISLEGAQMLGKHDHPEVSLHSHSLAKYMNFVYANDWAGVAELMRQAQVGSGSTRLPFDFYIAAGALYIALAVLSGLVTQVAERHYTRGVRPA